MDNEVCNDDRFKIIEIAKKHLLESTNIEISKDEIKVLDNFLFRCWQMNWLEMYNSPNLQDEIDYYKHEYFSECELREQLENALDKACEIIANMARQSEACIDNCPLESKGVCHVKCEDKDAWKAYLLGNDKQ